MSEALSTETIIDMLETDANEELVIYKKLEEIQGSDDTISQVLHIGNADSCVEFIESKKGELGSVSMATLACFSEAASEITRH